VVVWDDMEGTLRFLPGVGIPETSEPRERLGGAMPDCEDGLACALSVADMMLNAVSSKSSQTSQF